MMEDAFSFHAYVGDYELRASVYQDGWEPDRGVGIVLLAKQVFAHCGDHAICRFREWQTQGYGDSWLMNQPAGRKRKLYTVESRCQTAQGVLAFCEEVGTDEQDEITKGVCDEDGTDGGCSPRAQCVRLFTDDRHDCLAEYGRRKGDGPA